MADEYQQLNEQLNKLYIQYQQQNKSLADRQSHEKQELTRLETEKIQQQQLYYNEISLLHKRLADIDLTLYSQEASDQTILNRLRQEISEISFMIENQKEEFEKQITEMKQKQEAVQKQLADEKDTQKLEIDRLLMLIQEKEMLGSELSSGHRRSM